MRLRILFTALFAIAVAPLFSQVAPATKPTKLPISIGVGFSNFYTDWSRRESGPYVWADWNFYHAPSILRGLGLEINGRDLNYAKTGDVPNLREDTAGGGVIYTFRNIHRLHYYGKFLLDYGSIDFTANSSTYHHATRTVAAPGTGAEYHLWQNLWIRGDYEWEFWPKLGHGNTLSPNGFTIGASYEIGPAEGR